MIYREVPEVCLVELLYVVAEEDLEGRVELAVGRRRYPLRHGTLKWSISAHNKHKFVVVAIRNLLANEYKLIELKSCLFEDGFGGLPDEPGAAVVARHHAHREREEAETVE